MGGTTDWIWGVSRCHGRLRVWAEEPEQRAMAARVTEKPGLGAGRGGDGEQTGAQLETPVRAGVSDVPEQAQGRLPERS